MTDGLSRRDLMLLGGAGMGAAAFAQPPQAADAELGRAACFRNSADYSGHWPPHGKPPSGPPEYECNVATPKFAPDYLTLIHINFVRKWVLSVNTACFRFPGKDEGERLQRAIDLFGVKRPASGRKKRFAQLTGDDRPYRRQNRYDFDDFDKFGFASQHEIFFLLDNPNVELDQNWLLSFAPASDIDEPMAPNYSFFYAKAVRAWLHGGTTNAGWIIRVRNYFTDPSGQPISLAGPPLRYALNLHFKIKSPTGHIPMIIDPETGNGAGNEP